jgi:cell division protein FtsZ
MSINIKVPENILLRPVITVFGVGGAGGNAVNNMISAKLQGVNFVAANTDSQSLEISLTDRRIQLGETITRGLGAGALPDVGSAAAEEAMEQILEHLQDSNMVFITAGMGGGTGTGAAPIIAKAAKEQGILTIGVVTKPFHFEGAHRMSLAERGIEQLEKYVDTLIVIPNQNLFRVANENTTFADAFMLADNVLHAGVRGITDLMIMPGLINLDFADIKTVMSEMGKAMMGTGEAEGEDRAAKAAEAAISNPLLAHASMKGAKGVLINITGGKDMTLFEVDEAANRIRDEVENENANIIFGSTFNDQMKGKIRVSVVATGIDQKSRASSILHTNIPSKKLNISDVSINTSATHHPAKDDNNKSISNELEEIFELTTPAEDSKAKASDPANFELNFQPVSDDVSSKTKKTNIKLSFSNLLNKFAGKPSKEEKINLSTPVKNSEDIDQEIYEIPAFIRRNKGD